MFILAAAVYTACAEEGAGSSASSLSQSPSSPLSGESEAVEDECSLGVEAVCFCLDYYGYACDGPDGLLALCVAGDDDGYFACAASFVDRDAVDCESVLYSCELPDTGT